tara:strand:+ start:139 stop:735 length:597 start_codon:yes stop_codon:yes gene_type:complete
MAKTKKQKLTDTVKKMAKKSESKTDKDALKSLLLKEVKDKKEQERLERVEANKDLETSVVWTHSKFPVCTQVVNKFKDEGIPFIEKDAEKSLEEWDKISIQTNQNQFPTVICKGEFLVNNRDFKTADQIVNIVQKLANKKVVIPPYEIRMLEGYKNMATGIGLQLQQLGKQLGAVQQKLQPIEQFINKLKEEIESEDE